MRISLIETTSEPWEIERDTCNLLAFVYSLILTKYFLTTYLGDEAQRSVHLRSDVGNELVTRVCTILASLENSSFELLTQLTQVSMRAFDPATL